jgi:hypothetical protein
MAAYPSLRQQLASLLPADAVEKVGLEVADGG